MGMAMPGWARVGAIARWGAAGVAVLLVGALSLLVATEPRDRTSRLALTTEVMNFREVDPGKLYRSGQLNGEQLADAIDQLGIKTVINLRGRATEPWYREEKEVAREKGVRHVDVRFSARRIPTRDQLIVLLDAFRDEERPILMHCNFGADRVGEAAAIYQMEYMGKSRQEALDMLTLRYLHLEWRRPAKRYFIEIYGGEQWAREVYDPCDFEHFNKRKYCRHR
jgi:protein tyrosine/serine phosphatase